MKSIIKIVELIGADIRSRQNADFIRNNMHNRSGVVELDFDGVQFISRSFADEIYTIVNMEKDDVVLKNMKGVVKSMMNVVSESRSHKRVRKTDNSNIKEFTDIKSLSVYFSTL